MSGTGLVVARYRRHVTVESGDGRQLVCQIASRALDPLAGDDVVWHADAGGGGTVTAVGPRRSTLHRIDRRGRPEAVAANLSQLIIVVAAEPPPEWLMLDRYLCAAELAALNAIIVYNKVELALEPPARLADYRRVGYPVHPTSAAQGTGLTALRRVMRGNRSAMVGQSGVGKSSLLNALLGDDAQATGELTGKGAQGRHTTTTSTLYRLASGGELIDSPGARSFAPYIADPRQLERGFREVVAAADRCRFADCRHLAEPDCGVREAVRDHRISESRYESYRALTELIGTVASRQTRTRR